MRRVLPIAALLACGCSAITSLGGWSFDGQGDSGVNADAGDAGSDLDDGGRDAGACSVSFYADRDEDGFGDPAEVESGCEAPAGYVENVGDCDDSSSSIYPGAAESCNGQDDDCDSGIDEGTFGLRGAARTIASDVRGISLASDGTSFWMAWAGGTQISVAEVDAAGSLTGVAASFPTTAANIPSIAIADTPAGTRAVVAWREGAAFVATVIDLSDGSATGPFTLGVVEGDQAVASVAALGPRAVVAWLSGRRLRARTVDPVGGVVQGVLLDEEVSSTPGPSFQLPWLQADPGSDRLWVTLPVQRAADAAPAVYLGWISLGASPVWSGAPALARTAPYPSILFTITASPRDGRLPTMIYGGTDGTCLTHALLDAPTSYVDACTPTVGLPTGNMVRRGGVVSTLLKQAGGRLALADIPDVEGTSGGSFVDLSPGPTGTAWLALSDDPRVGLVAYEAGSVAPYSLTVQPVGCE